MVSAVLEFVQVELSRVNRFFNCRGRENVVSDKKKKCDLKI